MLERDQFMANESLVRFLTNFSEVLELQLNEVCKSISEALSQVMDSIGTMAEETERGKNKAEKTLEDTYLNPDEDTAKMVESIQGSVDDILAQAMSAGSVDNSEDDSSSKLRRLGGQFSKHMEALSTLDAELQDFLMIIMGALSNDDVISQRLEHITRSLNALKVGLAYVLVDVNSRFTVAGIETLKKDLLDYTFRQYCSEEERNLHEKHFGKNAA